jgi:hypothetical protein
VFVIEYLHRSPSFTPTPMLSGASQNYQNDPPWLRWFFTSLYRNSAGRQSPTPGTLITWKKNLLRQTERIFHLGSDGGSISIVDKLANQQ